MNTTMNTVILYLRKTIFHNKVACFLIFFIVAEWGYSQSGKKPVDLSLLYRSELKAHLFPQVDTLKIKEVVLFLAEPSSNPEYSIRVIDIDNQSFIEGRLLEKSLWNELFQHLKGQNDKPLSLNVSFFSIPVSKEFKNSMMKAFTNIIHNKKFENDMPVDGITYQFWIFDKKERIRSVEVNTPETGTIEDSLAILCSCMVNDLKSQSFDELKYIDRLK